MTEVDLFAVLYEKYKNMRPPPDVYIMVRKV